MNKLIAFVEIISTLSFAVALVVASRIPQKNIDTPSRIFLSLALAIYVFNGFSNILEYGGITDKLDVYGDHIEILYVPFFIFFLYSFNSWHIRRKYQESENRYEEVFQSSGDGVWLWGLNKDGMPNRLIDVNGRATEMLGYDKDELLTMTPADFVAPEFKPRMAPIVKEIQTKGRATYEMLHLRKDGNRLPVEVSSHTFYLGNEKVTLSIVRDITERKKAEEALQMANERLEMLVEERTAELLKSQERYRHLFNSGKDYILVHGYRGDAPGTFIEVNDMACNVLGYTREEFLNLTPFDIDSSESPTDAAAIIRHLFEKGQALFEQMHVTKHGMKIPVEIHTHIIDLGGDKIALSICRDITGRKKAEKEIKKSLKEKEVLLQEIHHRVKNNMQIISSLLRLQSGYIKDEEIVHQFLESQNRIRSMALIHEKLYMSENIASIDFKNYVRALSESLRTSFGRLSRNVSFAIDMDDISLNTDTAIACGLIINELGSNSIKHAFPTESGGEIRITLNRNDTNELELTVADNGIGIPEDIDFRNPSSLGLDLVSLLAENQLGGKIELDNSRGTKFLIRFRELQYNKRV